MDIAHFGAAFLAGVLTILSPCVLPILPIVFGSAGGAHRFGPAALASGLAVGFTAIALFLATVGFALGFDAAVFRKVSGVLLLALAAVLLWPRAHYAVQGAMQPIGTWAADRQSRFVPHGLAGQFAVGLLLGMVWSPCVGPTLGAASLLAAQGEALGSVTLTMLVFGIGAALPLLLLGMAGREAMRRVAGRLANAGRAGKLLLGSGLALAGALVLTGYDKTLETLAVQHGPAWASDLSTRF